MSFESKAVALFLVLLVVLIVLGVIAWRSRNDPAPYDPEDDEFPFGEIEADREADAQDLDVVGSAFENFQESVAEILDRDPVRRDELIRRLEAATEDWAQTQFDALVAENFPPTT